MQRAVLYVVAACMAITACSFLTVYAAVTAFTDETWPD